MMKTSYNSVLVSTCLGNYFIAFIFETVYFIFTNGICQTKEQVINKSNMEKNNTGFFKEPKFKSKHTLLAV